MNKKLTYEQPSCDLFVIKVEENFMSFDNDNNTEKFTFDGDEDL